MGFTEDKKRTNLFNFYISGENIFPMFPQYHFWDLSWLPKARTANSGMGKVLYIYDSSASDSYLYRSKQKFLLVLETFGSFSILPLFDKLFFHI